MYGKLVRVNWVLSFLGLMCVNEYNSLWICIVGFAWFSVSSVLLIFIKK